ncbi:putative uronyl 2-sulfotransferase [Apostichopus japonicus]|uniref:Putative uronyl 2-sulfotransferase n=1 Tax=Stichopus japonicus TaxID=307972 RepID=A0A2G8LQB0_STIJA|nr:putative uronyl 2-sulfotransferase [Apostichopus japonicus]
MKPQGIWKKSRPLSFDLNPVNGTNITIIHNAVPKTGSRALELLVRKFTFRYKDKIRCKESFPPEIADNSEKINEFVQSLQQGSYLRGHFPFQSFSESDVNVAFINIVRPPIERLQSNYYFDLYGDGESNPQNNAVYHQPKERNFAKTASAPCIFVNIGLVSLLSQTIDECIKNDVCFRKVYSYYRGSTLKTFCGLISDAPKSTFRTAKKIPLKNETLEFLKRDMSLENEFYRFVQEGFETATRLLLRNRTTVERTQ